MPIPIQVGFLFTQSSILIPEQHSGWNAAEKVAVKQGPTGDVILHNAILEVLKSEVRCPRA